MRVLDEHAIDALASVELGLTAARETARLVAGGALVTGRLQIGDTSTWMRLLAGMLPDQDLVGLKEFHRVGKRVRYHVSLHRYCDGDALGIIDGRRLTSLRTAATAALAFEHFFGSRPLRLAVIGSGEEAKEGLRAVAGTCSLEAVAVFSPTRANRDAFAAAVREDLGLEARASDSPADVLRGAHAAYVATAARAPLLRAADVDGLAFVAAVGATRPEHHELVGDVVSSAPQVVVDCEDAIHEPGDMIDAVSGFGWEPASAVLLGHWLAHDPVRDGGDPVLFKSIGSIEQDLVLASHLLKAAEEQGLGEEVGEIGSLRVMR